MTPYRQQCRILPPMGESLGISVKLRKNILKAEVFQTTPPCHQQRYHIPQSSPSQRVYRPFPLNFGKMS